MGKLGYLNRLEEFVILFSFFQYGDMEYILKTFPIAKCKDKSAHDENLTKRIILEMYDQMAVLPTMHVPAPKDESAMYAVPDVSQWLTWLSPGRLIRVWRMGSRRNATIYPL